MKMSTLTPSFAYGTMLPPQKEHKVSSRLKISAQRSQFEGWSSNPVDLNMMVPNDRIKVMRTKKTLKGNHRPYGWDYASNYIHKPKKHPEYLQTILLIFGPMSFSILFGTTLICIFSLVVHLIL
ncbi:unnamed protein product [Lactuca virosa]|uniref:Uncharacterized protein n=1 Tax=Lactuca virosa TaxID=75947 RepID=A0AAU9M3R3_9ASTR|nr:unnamed protein product [Lactuca virosa]